MDNSNVSWLIVRLFNQVREEIEMSTQENSTKHQLLVKEILNRKNLKFKLPKENQEAKIYISFRNYEDEPGYIDVKIYKLHGAFCTSLEYMSIMGTRSSLMFLRVGKKPSPRFTQRWKTLSMSGDLAILLLMM